MGKRYTNYYGLIFECPVGSELVNCAFKKIRQIKTKERLTYFDALTDEEKKTLIEKHQKCLSVREKKTLFYESQ